MLEFACFEALWRFRMLEIGPSLACERVRLLHEIVSAPFAVGAHHLLCRCGRVSRGFVLGLALLLHADEIGVGGEIFETLAFEIGERFEFVLLHEGEQLVAHRLHAFVAELHHAGADLHRVGAEQNELRRVVAGFDAADARQRAPGKFACGSWSRFP